MGGMFSTPKVKEPPPAPIEPPPAVEDTGVEESERRRIKKRRGRETTFLTGDLTPDMGKKTLLG